ncbi:MAG: hypothetical protein EOO81_01040 [Oxalobacteraceae bacterium]|nr:MAG: hypothetical protein EOO81_01040 [Oxalobacteraceae bacterium]
MIVCPEPSPDALSAGSISLSVDASKASVADLRAALASAEQAGNIGLRTQSIQLLRDQLAYLCLMRLSDPQAAAHESEYVLLFKRYQSAVLGVLAIEQLTGAVKAQPLTVSASGSATVNIETAAKTPTAGTDSTSTPISAEDSKTEDLPTDSSITGGKSAVITGTNLSAGGTGTKDTAKKDNKETPRAAVHNRNLAAISSTGAPAPRSEVRPAEAGKSDMAVVADTVYKIVNLIVVEAFGAENCASEFAKTNPSPTVLEGCRNVKARYENCTAQNRDPMECAQQIAQSTEAGSSSSNRIGDSPVKLANVARNLNLAFDIPVAVRAPFNALKFGIFRCVGAPRALYDAMYTDLTARLGVATQQIRNRGEFSIADLKSKGFSGTATAEVLFDQSDPSEEEGSQQLVKAAQQVLDAQKIKGSAIRRQNKAEETKLYLSIAFCPNAA